MFPYPARMHLTVLACSLACSLPLAGMGQLQDDEWIDPYDMLNYDASTKTMRKPHGGSTQEPTNYPNVPTKRREYIQDSQDSNQVELTVCNKRVEGLQREIEDQKKRIVHISQQPTCNPVFKRFLSKLLKEIERVGVSSDLNNDILYNAKVKLSRQSVAEIRKLLEGDESWQTGALDDAVSQILVDLKPHNYEAWKWHFEDTFGVEINTVFMMCASVMVIVIIICTQLWSTVSWFVQFRRLLAICFFISIIWNWFYLYKTAFAEHQNNIAKMDSVSDKCTGLKKIGWSDGLKEWYRSTWTLQDDPCKKYYENLIVNPILLVPPTKAIAVTITTFITEPLKHVGQGISEFLIALLKDLPITLQIPVLLTIVLSILVFLYGSVQAAFQYGITAPLRRRRSDPPPPAMDPPQPQPPRLSDADHYRLAEGDAPHHAPRPQAIQGRLDRAHVRQRRPNRAREEPKVVVETLRNTDRPYSEDEIDAEQRGGVPDTEQPESLSDIDSASQTERDSDEQEETQEELAGANATSVAGDLHVKHSQAKIDLSATKAKSKPANSPQAKAKPPNANRNTSQAKSCEDSVASHNGQTESSEDTVASHNGQTESSEDTVASHNGQTERPKEDKPSQAAQGNDAQVLEASVQERTSSSSVEHVETVGAPVEETAPTPLTR